MGLAVGQSLFHSGRRAEIDDHIALAVQLFQTVVHGDAVLLTVLLVDPGDHAACQQASDRLLKTIYQLGGDSYADQIG